MAPKSKPARFAFVFGMAVTILAMLTWLSRDLAAPTPPTEPIYQSQLLLILSAGSGAHSCDHVGHRT